MSELPEYIKCLLADIARAEGFTAYECQTKAGSNHGDNFVGVLTSVTLSGTRLLANGTTIPDELRLLCKLAPSNAAQRKEFQSVALFQREIDAYTKYLPLLAAFQREKGLTDGECFNAYPTVYAAVCDESKDQIALIMDDLRDKQFMMWPKATSITKKAAFAVIGHLAKFHATSFALKDQRPETYKQFDLTDLMEIILRNSSNLTMALQMGLDRAIGVLHDERHKDILTQVRNNLARTLNDCMRPDTFEPFGVLGHGDCWINNLMFQFHGTQVQFYRMIRHVFSYFSIIINFQNNDFKHVNFIDWQLLRFCSPVLDLHYFIFTATDKALRDREYANLMKFYYVELTAAIRRLGSDPAALFPEHEFYGHLKKFGKYACVLVPFIIQLMMADPKDVANMEQVSKADGDANVDFVRGYAEETQQKYADRINEFMENFVECGYWVE